MYLVDEEHRAPAVHGELVASAIDDGSHISHSRSDRRELREDPARCLRYERGKRGLAGARRTPEDHRDRRALAGAVEKIAKRGSLAQRALLADDLIDAGRPHANCERGCCTQRREPVIEEGHGISLGRPCVGRPPQQPALVGPSLGEAH